MRGDRSHYRQDRSPRREAINSELDEHSNRIKDLLKADLTLLQEQNAILKNKCKKLNELEDRNDQLSRQNSHLITQNEKMVRVINHHHSQTEMLKNKYDSHLSQKIGETTEFEFERKKLYHQIQNLKQEINELQKIKSLQFQELKSQYQTQYQSLKRQNITTQQIYENEIRKIRQQLDKKDYELNEYINKLKRISSDYEYEIIKLKEQKQKYKNELLYIENDRKQNITILKQKLDHNYGQEIQILKKTHLNNIEILQNQNIKLKFILDEKQIELEKLNKELQKQKKLYEQNNKIILNQNKIIKQKMLQFQQIINGQKNNLVNKLNIIHNNQIKQLQINHQKYNQCLKKQIQKLENFNITKNLEIQQLIKQKKTIKQIFDQQNIKLKDQIQLLNFQLKNTDIKLNKILQEMQKKIIDKDKHIQYLDRLNFDQRNNYTKQLQTMQQIIQHQKLQLESQKIKYTQNEQNLKENLNQYKNQCSILKDNLKKQKNDRQKLIQDIQNGNQNELITLRTQLDSSNNHYKLLEKQIEALNNTILLKEKQLQGIKQRLTTTQQHEQKLEKQFNDLRLKMVKKDQKSNQMLNDQKIRLQESFVYTIQNMKSDHETLMHLEAHKIVDLKEKLDKKERQMQNWLKMYKKMTDEWEQLTHQEANKKQLTLKFPGATADLIATKNLFDVFLKTKVLEVCGDSIDQQQ